MSSHTSVLPAIQPSFGLGTMPGSSSSRNVVTTLQPPYGRRSSSASRKFDDTNSTTAGLSTLNHSHPASHPLPPLLGHQDLNGKKFNKLTNDFKKSSGGTTRNRPLRGDHSSSPADLKKSSIASNSKKFSETIHAGSNASPLTDNVNRSIRSRSVACRDHIAAGLSRVKLNSYDSVKASPRTLNSDDGAGRESRRDRYEQHDTCTHSVQYLNNSKNILDDSITHKNSINIHHAPSSSHNNNEDNSVCQKNSTKDVQQSSMPLSQQSSMPLLQQSSMPLSQPSSSGSTSTGSASKYLYNGKVGLRNIGNTCFMNSVVQCLSNTRPLLEYTLNETYVLDQNKTTSKLKGSLIVAYANLITSFWKEKNSSFVSPNNFKSQIQKFAPRFSGYQQQDAQEFLRYLLEGLHEDVNRVTVKPKHSQINDDLFTRDSEKAAEYWKNYLKYDDSKIVDIFVGQLKSELKFRECGHKSVTFDPFWDLSLPIPKHKVECDIADCLQLFMKEEELDGDESPTCAKCKTRRSCTKRFSIQKFPQILVLHLKRFSQERYSRKILTLVNFPITNLDMTEFAAENGQRPIYNLYAVSEHSGTTYGGHYTAKCKHPYTGEWNSFNDTQVSHCGANESVSSEAYVLFFELGSNALHL